MIKEIIQYLKYPSNVILMIRVMDQKFLVCGNNKYIYEGKWNVIMTRVNMNQFCSRQIGRNRKEKMVKIGKMT